MTTAPRREHTALTQGRGNAVQACYTGRLQLDDDGGKIGRSLVGARLANLASRVASGGRETAASEATNTPPQTDRDRPDPAIGINRNH
jgi:hypothetical protein